jgi:hypothetical protein
LVNSVLGFFKSPSGTCASPPVLLDIGHDMSFICQISYFP